MKNTGKLHEAISSIRENAIEQTKKKKKWHSWVSTVWQFQITNINISSINVTIQTLHRASHSFLRKALLITFSHSLKLYFLLESLFQIKWLLKLTKKSVSQTKLLISNYKKDRALVFSWTSKQNTKKKEIWRTGYAWISCRLRMFNTVHMGSPSHTISACGAPVNKSLHSCMWIWNGNQTEMSTLYVVKGFLQIHRLAFWTHLLYRTMNTY